MPYKILIDAGHGGEDLGATYNGRQEKDDTLMLALAVGQILESRGIDVIYSRTDDRYDTPFEKAMKGNAAGADLFVSIHRNAMPIPGTAEGVETLVYNDQGIPALLARNINRNLEALGFANLGVTERKNLVVLRRTQMPAVLIEVGFIDSENDNARFDEYFDQIAEAIADAILETLNTSNLPMNDPNTANMADRTNNDSALRTSTTPESPEKLYRVQVGAFRSRFYAERLLRILLFKRYPAFLTYNETDQLFRVQVGAFRNMDNAVRMERRLRKDGFNTFITF